ncbi:hypothetical protein [Marinobacter zhanjiangensis]|uniref:Extracellular solute-binding protein, family 7 n=1 Tax=Marinobacter zhanjiangensis TaxID=578215 RepID=A0ABQ3B5S3_9GAMM|nr:hypothetical protein [Marinobacter zhanjiangensis]GGY76258.1 hypothetical protein GCM10007071_24600 [Marinobacter zhanjiangensis]
MECPSITNLTLGKRDVETLEQIRKKIRNMDMISMILPAGAMMNIFMKNNTVGAAYNISTFEWQGFANAMANIPSVKRGFIQRAAGLRAMEESITYQQKQFWRAVYYGCDVEEAL